MITVAGIAAVAMSSCSKKAAETDFKYLIDEFADLKIMKYQVPGWDNLTLQQKEYVYHLSEAAKYGRDILWAQNCSVNLDVRHALEDIIATCAGEEGKEEYDKFLVYAKRVFFSNGIHHHYSEDKFFPECSKDYFTSLLMKAGYPMESVISLTDIVYNPDLMPQRKSTNLSGDIVKESAVNFYEGVTKDEVEAYYASIVDAEDPEPVSYGLNSKLVKGDDGVIRERAAV